MKRHKPLSAGQLLFACCFLAAFAGITIFLFSYKRDERLYVRLTAELFQEEMLKSTLNMHYTLAVPADFGIPAYQAVLPCYDARKRMLSQADTENLLAALCNINPEQLSEQDAYSYTLLKRSLENSLAMSTYSYYEEPLSPSSGMQSQLPILLAEYTFRCPQDVTDYLSLLDQTDEYFASLLTFEQEKAAVGLIMPASSLKKVKEQCDTIVTTKELEAGSHFLQTTFAARLQELSDAGTLSAEEIRKFQMQNDRLLKTVLQPAYENLADGLFLLEDSSIPLAGLSAKPGGQEYYQYLLRSETGSYRSIPEVQKLLSKALRQEYEALRALAAQHSDELHLLSVGETTQFPIARADEMLQDLQFRMQPDFPSLPDSPCKVQCCGPGKQSSGIPDTLSVPAVTVKSVSSNLEAYCAPAFYLTAPLDDTDNNVIYINNKNSPSGLALYTTLAHEGYPGHLYQTVYNNRSFLQKEENPVREILWYGGYLEGWALYVEFCSFDYASALLEEHNQSAEALLVQMEKHNRSLQLCLYSLLDTMIHYENASYAQVAGVLKNFGISDPSAAAAIYTYIAEEPCNYLKYYLGYLEILLLREEARALWDSEYSDYAFHKFFLECGPSDFSSLRERLKQVS